jgi:hypothetical protein
LQCVLAAKILTVDFVVCTLAVKKNQGRFRHVGSDHSLVSRRNCTNIPIMHFMKVNTAGHTLMNSCVPNVNSLSEISYCESLFPIGAKL